ncbi:MAG TPA: zinc-binding dehydrogenase [Gaiellaceae bacterium]|nr:zinc-binding dehydrogenase [Gaiellaceae bacterium]
MRAVVIENGRPVLGERPDPQPGDGQVLIRVRAAGINNADLLQAAGKYPPPPGTPPDIPGLECAGEVAETGERVMALLPGAGQAELVAVDARHVLPVPDGVDWPAAAGFMEAFATAHDALVTQAQLRPGERLLVNGASGGVGTAAVQLGVALGAEVTGTARRPESRDLVRGLGAKTEPDGEYDVVLELVGGELLTSDVEQLAPHGRLAVIGTGAGSRAEVDFGLVMRKRARIYGSTLRSRSGEEKALVVTRLGEDVLPLLAGGRVTVPVHGTYPLDQAHAAYLDFAEPGKFGKLVLLA